MRVTADDVLVCRHDPVVEDGRFVIAMTAAETDALGLLRFADLLDGLPPALGVDVEVKSSLEDALRPRERTTAALVGRALAGREASRPLLVSSFDAAALSIAREHAAVPTGLLTWMRFPLRKAIPAAVHLGAAAVLPHFSSLGGGPAPARIERAAAEYVALAHEAGLEVATWAPSPEEASRCSPPAWTASSSTTPTPVPGRPGGPGRPAVTAELKTAANSPTSPGMARSNPRKPPARVRHLAGGVFRPRKGGGTATGAGRAQVARPTSASRRTRRRRPPGSVIARSRSTACPPPDSRIRAMRILVVGAGGVGRAVAAIARRRDFFERMVLADVDPPRARGRGRAARRRGSAPRASTRPTPARSPRSRGPSGST